MLIRIYRIAIALILSWIVVGCSKDPQQLFERAKVAHEKGDFATAVVDLKAAIQIEPNNAAMRHLLGRIHNDAFDGNSAEKELRKALELGLVDGGRVTSELARAYLLQRNFKKLAENIAEPPHAFEAEQRALIFAWRGHAFLTLGKVADAKAQHQEAIGIVPALPEATLLEARFLILEGKVNEANSLIDGVLSGNPKHFDASTMKAALMRGLRQYTDELAAYDRILALNPTYLDALVGRSTVLLRLGRVDDAQKDVNSMLRTYKGHPLTHFQQGLVHLYKERYRQALDASLIALKQNPDFGPALVLAGISHLALGANEQGERLLSKFVAENPQHAEGRRLLGQALIGLKQGERAIEVVKPLLRDQTRDSVVLSIVGDAYMQLGNNQKAKEYLDRAATVTPNDDRLGIKQTLLKMETEGVDSAIEDLERSARASGASIRNSALLVLTSTAKGDLDRATKALEDLKKLAPNHLLTHALKGHVLLAKGDLAGARDGFEAALRVRPGYFPAAAQLAMLDLRSGDHRAARGRFEAVLAADKNNLNAILALAQLQLQSGDRRKAQELLTEASRAHPGAMAPRIELVRMLVAHGEYSAARTVAQEVSAAHPKSPLALEMLAAAQLLDGETSSAVATAHRLVSLDRKSASASLKLAAALQASGDLKGAESSARLALKLRPGFDLAQNFLVNLLVGGKRTSEALEFAKSQQREQPKSNRGFLLEGDIFGANRDWVNASASYKRALSIGDDSAAQVKYVRALSAAGQGRDARKELFDFARKRPRDMILAIELADVLMRDGEYSSAAEYYSTIVQAVPGNAGLLNNLAWAHYKANDARALKIAEQAYQLGSHDPRIADTYGWILVHSGQEQKGVAILAKAASAAPGDGDLQFRLISAMAKAGERDKAQVKLRSLLASDVSFSERKAAEALLDKLR